MKKIYVSPRLFVLNSEASAMICASETYKLNGGANWGAPEGEYSPAEYVNEGHNDGSTTGGYTTSPIEDDDDDLPSRSKSSLLWDW